MTEDARRHARVIFEFHQLRHQPVPADVIVALGTNDVRVADHAARLYHEGFGRLLLCSGGLAHQNDLLATRWREPEAEVFARRAANLGVPLDHLLLETRATNTSENLRFSRALLAERGIRPDRIVIAVKPFMSRRAFATHAVVWPEMPATVSTWNCTFDEYCTDELSPDKITHIMMGDLQRIWIYARKGYSAAQVIPPEVQASYQALVTLGYRNHLIAEE